MRDELFERTHYVVRALRAAYPAGLTYPELADRIVEITRDELPCKRTLIRDIQRLRRQGFDIHERTVNRFKVLSLAPDSSAVRVPISDIQLLALSLAQELLKPLRGTIFWNGMRTFWNETMHSAPEETRRHFQRRRQQVIVRGTPAKSYRDKGGILSTLFDAQLSHREVAVVYAKAGGSPDENGSRTIRPYATAFYHGSIFVVAEDAAKESFRVFKLDRITGAERLDTFFRPRADFDAQAYFQSSMSVYSGGQEKPQRMTLRIAPQVAAHVAEQPWHDQQTLKAATDGGFVLTLPSVYPSEVIAKALSYGQHVEILTPKSCRERMRQTLESMLGAYK